MQAKSCHSIPPPIFPASPAKSLPANKVSFPAKISRAISITAPGDVISTQNVDDAVAAFWDYQFLFVSQRSETADPITLRVVDGAVPPDFPCGTYYLTGPGLFTDDHGSTVHPLDGHGYLRAFTVDGVKGKVKFMAKYIKTEAQTEERDPLTGRWRFTHRGPFSVLKGGKMVGNTKVMKNVANTSVLGWGERLFCLWEGGDPYEIDSRSLDTIGKFDVIDDDGDGGGGGDGSGESEMVGELKGGFWDVAATLLKPILYGVFNMPPKRLLSHCKIDAGRDRLLILSCNAEDMLLPCSHFTFYEFDSNFKMVQKKEFNIPDHLMIHDWAFTDSHYILFGNRIKLDITGSMAALFGLSPMISALAVNPSKPTSPIYLLPRSPPTTSNELNNGNERDWRVPIEAPSQMWVLHVGNAFENRDDDNANSQIHIQASVCSYRWFNFQKMFGYDWRSGKLDPSMMNRKEENLLPHLVQVSINLDANGECQECSVKPLNEWSKASDFPVINQDYSGAKNTYIYAATTSGSRQALPHFPFDTVLKLNTLNKSIHTWSVGSRRFIGEPIFVPKGNQEEEDDGYILVVEYAVSTQRCYLVVLSSKKIGKTGALVARLEVPRSLNFPLGFHGFWAPSSTSVFHN
uniref:Carotenoid cleavage dioxygenase 7 n=1 Tax=Camellia sinensis TaxID=4442 RepID=A0A2R4SC49_CAMSI|nr:carotenoid cleavage dioxygenase 7 [Camellia sinensis]